jgi:peptide-methionine (S)-S-oxide reductase
MASKDSAKIKKANAKTEKAVFAAGCFWGVQAEFDNIPGVISTVVGYTGGKTKNPSYEDVCTGKTGHAESVEVEYDPEIASYDDLLDAFWQIHNPTTKNRQGLDIGSQYRSAIFYFSDEQKKKALESLKNEQEKCSRPIVTEIKPAKEFYKAEEYHQHYLKKNKKAVC